MNHTGSQRVYQNRKRTIFLVRNKLKFLLDIWRGVTFVEVFPKVVERIPDAAVDFRVAFGAWDDVLGCNNFNKT
jgi:hypothetical protein